MQAGNVSQLFVSFQGEGLHAGRRQLFVRFGGCPLRCRYCDEPESLVPVAACRILGPDGERERPNPFTGAEIEAEIAGLEEARAAVVERQEQLEANVAAAIEAVAERIEGIAHRLNGAGANGGG